MQNRNVTLDIAKGIGIVRHRRRHGFVGGGREPARRDLFEVMQ